MKLSEKYLRPAVFMTTGLFEIFAILYFIPVNIPHKIAFPLIVLSVASFWMVPYQIVLAMLFSAAGDYMGSCGNFMFQLGFFAAAHLCFILYFYSRFKEKILEKARKSSIMKGFIFLVVICITALIYFCITVIVPMVPEQGAKAAVITYIVIISLMFSGSLVQRSTLYALGGTLFVFSDFILAWNKFVEPIEAERYLIMIPYYLGQWLLFVRSTNYRIHTDLRIKRF